jgi:hypothetical protein
MALPPRFMPLVELEPVQVSVSSLAPRVIGMILIEIYFLRLSLSLSCCASSLP